MGALLSAMRDCWKGRCETGLSQTSGTPMEESISIGLNFVRVRWKSAGTTYLPFQTAWIKRRSPALGIQLRGKDIKRMFVPSL